MSPKRRRSCLSLIAIKQQSHQCMHYHPSARLRLYAAAISSFFPFTLFHSMKPLPMTVVTARAVLT
jgi:hypothetical protein